MYVSNVVHFLNEHKEVFKEVLSVPTFVFGIFGAIGLYRDVPELYSDLKGRITKKEEESAPSWSDTVGKIIKVSTDAAILLNSLTSRPGQAIIGWTATKIVGKAQLIRLFGPNLNFVTNPYHPKHVCSIAALLLAIPGVLNTFYDEIQQCFGWKIISLQGRGIQWINIYNTITGRPLLHLVNLAVAR